MEHHGDKPYVIHAEGDLDAFSAPVQVEERVRGALIQGQRYIVVDLYYVRFVDSTTIRALVTLQDLVHGEGGRFVVRNVRPEVRRFLRLVALDALADEEA